MIRKFFQFGKICAYGATLWAMLFALLHFAWAAGWYIGLDAEKAQKAFQQKWFLLYDIIAGVLCLFCGIVVLTMTLNRKPSTLRTITILFALIGTGLLILRGGAGIVKIFYLLIIGKTIDSGIVWDVWFCLGAILFGFSVWHFLSGRDA